MEMLHNNKDLFLDALNKVTTKTGIAPEIVEKDYYVTLVLRLLSQKLPFIVFKGGTSLQKCHHIINRFSEDIDIAIDESISQGQKKYVKETIKHVALELGLTILNLDQTRSRRAFNRYILNYDSVLKTKPDYLKPAIIIESTFSIISFPTETMPVGNYIGEMMKDEAPDYIKQFCLDEFEMKVQSLERTFADKLFAICDYYLENKVNRHSRHIYDLFKLAPKIQINKSFNALFEEVRTVRKETEICPSAQDDIDFKNLISKVIDSDAYKSDFNNITVKLLNENVTYEECIEAIKKAASLLN